MDAWSQLKWDERGLVVVVVQERLSGEVRMVAWANREAVEATMRTGWAHFYSRSRQSLWKKGEQSGHVIAVDRVAVDCDGDTLIYLGTAKGPSCHTGKDNCFFRRLSSEGNLESAEPDGPVLRCLWRSLEARASSTAQRSYTRSLLDGGVDRIMDKVTEECDEYGEALRRESDERVASEAADVLYHLMVGLLHRGVSWDEVTAILGARLGTSGHDEKRGRGTVKEPTE